MSATEPGGSAELRLPPDHCSECREMADEFGLEGDDIERLGQWHEDHPGWALVPDELLAMTTYTTEAEGV